MIMIDRDMLATESYRQQAKLAKGTLKGVLTPRNQ